jgi:hypothetical protein
MPINHGPWDMATDDLRWLASKLMYVVGDANGTPKHAYPMFQMHDDAFQRFYFQWAGHILSHFGQLTNEDTKALLDMGCEVRET